MSCSLTLALPFVWTQREWLKIRQVCASDKQCILGVCIPGTKYIHVCPPFPPWDPAAPASLTPHINKWLYLEQKTPAAKLVSDWANSVYCVLTSPRTTQVFTVNHDSQCEHNTKTPGLALFKSRCNNCFPSLQMQNVCREQWRVEQPLMKRRMTGGCEREAWKWRSTLADCTAAAKG